MTHDCKAYAEVDAGPNNMDFPIGMCGMCGDYGTHAWKDPDHTINITIK